MSSPRLAGIHVSQPNMDPRFRGDDGVIVLCHWRARRRWTIVHV
ncbi:MAG TPA: hypothetical protein VIR34_13550 [Gemmatimonadaceae bacterium]